jgi:c-di-GMP-binding flagellar brake protein YcgR
MENRKDRRYEIAVDVQLAPSSTGGSFRGVAVNISASGVLILARHAEPRGTLLTVEFPKFGGIGQVIWTSESEGKDAARMGMKFVSLSPAARFELLKLLRSRSSQR